MKTVAIKKAYMRHGKLWVVYRYRNGRTFKVSYNAW